MTTKNFKLACITMVRDEASILPAFLSQLAEFFDHCVVLDHSSVDLSAVRCRIENRGRVELLHLHAPGYPQAEVTTLLARRLVAENGADVVFLLDCDEFLSFADRSALETFLTRHHNAGVDGVLMPWLNICPENLDGQNIFRGRFHRGTVSKYGKIALFRELFERSPGAQIHQGNHGVSSSTAPVHIVETLDAPLFHVPVRSWTQLALKLANGRRVILRDKEKLAAKLGQHWVDLALDFRTLGSNDSWIRHLALGYPNLAPEAMLSSLELLDFSFPHIRAEYHEDGADVASVVLRGLADPATIESEVAPV